MDRTDDLKKATYQVLKVSAEGNPTQDFNYKVGIISNIHAVRHFEDYLDSLKDIIWTRDDRDVPIAAKTAGELDPNTPLYNLFDGIIALTSIYTRDQWVLDTFKF